MEHDKNSVEYRESGAGIILNRIALFFAVICLLLGVFFGNLFSKGCNGDDAKKSRDRIFSRGAPGGTQQSGL